MKRRKSPLGVDLKRAGVWDEECQKLAGLRLLKGGVLWAECVVAQGKQALPGCQAGKGDAACR